MNTPAPLTINEATKRGATALRWALAARRDRLVRRQRQDFSSARQELIDRLGDQYRAVYGIQLEAEKIT